MKLIGKFLRFAFTEKGDIEATFVVSNHFLQSLQKLDKERLLDIKVDEKKITKKPRPEPTLMETHSRD